MAGERSWDWGLIEYVLLDMDGTLLDKDFDDYFWEEYVPRVFAEKEGLPYEEARGLLLAKYKEQEGTLNWTDIDYWSKELGLDILGLKESISSRIRLLPDAGGFLQYLQRRGKPTYLVTNAHPKTIQLKLRETSIGPYFRQVLSAFDLGVPKDSPRFWQGAKQKLSFREERSLYIDDDPAALEAAQRWGIGHLMLRVRPGISSLPSQNRFLTLVDFREIIPAER